MIYSKYICFGLAICDTRNMYHLATTAVAHQNGVHIRHITVLYCFDAHKS